MSADEAKQLGTTLTAVGAEKAGNKEGTIPAYTGGLTTPPASFKKGDNLRPDPFANEKPRLVIDAKNVAQHADKLTAGTQELIKRVPGWRVDVYPTHRTIAYPKRYLDNTVKNATGAKSVDGGLGMENALAGCSLPDPQDRGRGDVEPPDALRRSCLHHQVPELERRFGRRGDAWRWRPRPGSSIRCRIRRRPTRRNPTTASGS